MPRLLLAIQLLLTSIPSVALADPDGAEDARRLTAILDYVAADYGGAVRDGQVVSELEYAEQVGFLDDAATLAARLPPSPADAPDRVASLQAAVASHAAPEVVTEACRTLRADVATAYGVVMAPTAPLSRAEGQRLYASECATCHGVTGGADTPIAATLEPPPRNFRDPEVMASLTPVRAYNALTDGVAGTSMSSFARLSDVDRWNLAFFLFTLRHGEAAEERGRVLGVAPTVADLARASDGELASTWPTPDAVAWLRGRAPYLQDERVGFGAARAGLDASLVALSGGDRIEARRLAGEAYLSGFEPHEATLRQVSPALVRSTEEAFLRVRSEIDRGGSVEEVRSEVLRTGALLDDAEAALDGAHGPRVAFLGALLVILREGLEGALLVLLLLGYARSRGGSAVGAVHAGWGAAVALGVVCWVASDYVVALAGSRRELLEGAVTLLAAGILVTAHHWLAAPQDARRRVDHIRRTISADGGQWTLAVLAFGAVFREAFEVVLFLQAIALDSTAGSRPILAGAVAGFVALVATVGVMMRLGKRVPTGRLLTGASMLLSVLAVVMTGNGVRALQEAGVVGIVPVPVPRLDVIGLYPTAQTVLAQVVVLAGLMASVAWGRRVRPPSQNDAAPQVGGPQGSSTPG